MTIPRIPALPVHPLPFLIIKVKPDITKNKKGTDKKVFLGFHQGILDGFLVLLQSAVINKAEDCLCHDKTCHYPYNN